MSDTTQVLLIDGKPIGYFPPTSAENVTYEEGVSVKDALDELGTDGGSFSLTWGASKTIPRDSAKAYLIMSGRNNTGSFAYVTPNANERVIISASTPTIASVTVSSDSIVVTASSTGEGSGAWVTILAFNVPII